MSKTRALLFFLSSLSFSIPAVAQVSEIFTKHTEIFLPDNHLIGNIEALDVFGDSYLIADTFQQQQIYLYKERSDDLVRLDPEGCFPGFTYHPINAFHLADQSLFLVNSGLPGYRFKPDGSCLGDVKKGFIQVHKKDIAVGSAEDFFTIRMMPNGEIILDQYAYTGKPLEEMKLGAHPLPHFNYRYEGGGIVFYDGIIYYMLSSGKVMYRYDVERNQLLEEISFDPSYASAITKDIPNAPFSNAMVKALNNRLSAHYVIHSVFKLSQNLSASNSEFI